MLLQGTAPQVGLRISLHPDRHGSSGCFRERVRSHLGQRVHTVTHREIPLHTNSIYIGVGLVFQTHETISVVVSKRGLGRFPSDWITRVSIRKSLNRERWSVGSLWCARHFHLWCVTAATHHHRLFHHVDAVTLHQLLKQIEDLFCPGTLECKYSLPSLTATTALERKEVGVVAVAAQAEIWPPDGVSFTCVENEFSLGELHDPRSQLIALIVHIGDLKFGKMVVSDGVSVQTAPTAPHSFSRPAET